MTKLDVVQLIDKYEIDPQWIEPDRVGLSNKLRFFSNHTITIYFEDNVMVCVAIDDISMYPESIYIDQNKLTLYIGETKISSIPLSIKLKGDIDNAN